MTDNEADIEIEEVSAMPIYIAETEYERRRQWCMDMACYYFSGQGIEKVLKAAQLMEKFLTASLPRQV